MARLASQMKMGFYKTPTHIVEEIKRMLVIPPGARLLDTCCGEGEALDIISSGTGASTYGVELDRERFNKAKKVLGHVLWADALHEVRIPPKAFGLLWLNPPYDFDEGGYDQEKERLEHQFLKRHWTYIADGGVLVYIIPLHSLERVAQYLVRRARQVCVFSFPEDDFSVFHQIIVLAVKGRPGKRDIEKNTLLFENVLGMYSWQLPTSLSITNRDGNRHFSVPPAADQPGFYFRATRLDPDEALKLVRASGLATRVKSELFPPVDYSQVHPLTPLREGHLAMLLASGMMNGEVSGEKGKKLIVKGSVKKTTDSSYEETETSEKHIVTDRYEITVRAICFEPLEIITIK